MISIGGKGVERRGVVELFSWYSLTYPVWDVDDLTRRGGGREEGSSIIIILVLSYIPLYSYVR